MLYSRSTFTLRVFIIWITIFSVLFGSQQPVATRAAVEVPKTLFVSSARASTDGLVSAAFDDTDIVHVLRDELFVPVSTGSATGTSFSNTVPPAITRFNPQSLNVVAAGDYIEVADHPALDNLQNTFTVAAWIKRSTLNVGATIYDSGTQTGHMYVGFLSNNKMALTRNAVADFASATHTVNDTNWHHVAYVVNNSSLTMYLDGVPDAQQAVAALNTPSGVKLIGNRQAKNTGLRGLLDELRLYNRALSAAEITRLAAGKGCPMDGSAWDKAFTNLQCALNEAASGDQIWVAKGEYHPGTAPAATFAGKSGVKVYGGFSGSESDLAMRPTFILPPTVNTSPIAFSILSGDVNGNDNPFGLANYTDNNRFVVSNLAVNSSATWDGFVIRSGSSNFISLAPDAPGAEPEPGGGMFNFNSSVALENLAFIANKGTRTNYGGGLTNVNSAITLRYSTFIGNLGYAGGMYTKGLTPSLREVIFEENGGTSMGGGLGVDSGGLSIEYSYFKNNSSLADGAGLSSKSGTIDLYWTEFTDNFAKLGGGGVFITDTVATLSKVDLIGNFATAGTGGGGLKAVKSTLKWSYGTVEGNQTENSTGGGLAINGGVTKLDRLKVLGNTDQTATAAAMDILNTSSFTVTNSLFVGNAPQSSQTGNAIRVSNSLSKFINVTFANNAKLNDPVANSADVSVDNLFKLVSNAQSVLLNCILWDHKSNPFDLSAGSLFIATRTIEGRSGSGLNPRFISNPNPGDGNWNTTFDNQYGDLRLLPDSPAIDYGRNTLLPAGLTNDLDLKPRFFDVPFVPNTGTGTPTIDAGAYEARWAALIFLPQIAK